MQTRASDSARGMVEQGVGPKKVQERFQRSDVDFWRGYSSYLVRSTLVLVPLPRSLWFERHPKTGPEFLCKVFPKTGSSDFSFSFLRCA